MDYTDEKIIGLKKAKRNQEFNDICDTGIYIEDHLVLFNKLLLFDEKIQVLLPENFIDMPEPVKQMKYPSNDRPQAIMTSLDSTVNFAFSFFTEKVPSEQAEVLAGQFKDILKITNPAAVFYQEETVSTPTGNRVSMFDFKNFGIDEQIYNLMCVMVIHSGVIHGVFNCPDQASDEWREAARDVFARMEEMSERKGEGCCGAKP